MGYSFHLNALVFHGIGIIIVHFFQILIDRQFNFVFDNLCIFKIFLSYFVEILMPCVKSCKKNKKLFSTPISFHDAYGSVCIW